MEFVNHDVVEGAAGKLAEVIGLLHCGDVGEEKTRAGVFLVAVIETHWVLGAHPRESGAGLAEDFVAVSHKQHAPKAQG